MGEIAVSDFLSVTILWASSGFDSSFASLCTTSPLTSSGFDSSFASFDSSDALEFFTAASSVSSLGDFGEVAGLGDGVDYHWFITANLTTTVINAMLSERTPRGAGERLILRSHHQI